MTYIIECENHNLHKVKNEIFGPVLSLMKFKTEQTGIESIKEYTRIKTTWFNTSEKPMSDSFTMG